MQYEKRSFATEVLVCRAPGQQTISSRQNAQTRTSSEMRYLADPFLKACPPCTAEISPATSESRTIRRGPKFICDVFVVVRVA